MKSRAPAAPFPPLLVLAIAILAVSTASILIRYAQRDAPSLAIAALRLLFASLALAPAALTRRRSELSALQPRDFLWLLLSGFFLALHFATWITSLEYTSVASSVVLVQTTPLWVALLGLLVLKEPLHHAVLAAVVLSLLGGVIVGLSNACAFTALGLACRPLGQLFAGRALFGNALALSGAIFVSGYLLIGRSQRARLSLLSYTFVVYSTAALLLVAGALLFGQPLTGYPPRFYLVCLALALIPQLLGHSSFNWALRYLSTTYVSVALLGEPIGSTILAYILLRQPPTAFELVGGALILAGIYLASRGQQ